MTLSLIVRQVARIRATAGTYFVIVADSNTIQPATLVNANAYRGSLTGDGTGEQISVQRAMAWPRR